MISSSVETELGQILTMNHKILVANTYRMVAQNLSSLYHLNTMFVEISFSQNHQKITIQNDIMTIEKSSTDIYKKNSF